MEGERTDGHGARQRRNVSAEHCKPGEEMHQDDSARNDGENTAEQCAENRARMAHDNGASQRAVAAKQRHKHGVRRASQPKPCEKAHRQKAERPVQPMAPHAFLLMVKRKA